MQQRAPTTAARLLTLAALALALLGACGSSHTPGGDDAGTPRPDAGPPPGDGGGLRCGDGTCAPGERCCPGCEEDGFCVPAGSPCPVVDCPPPAWRTCEEALEFGSPGDACLGGWSCGSAGGCCTARAECAGGSLVVERACRPGCGGCATSDECPPDAFCDHPGEVCGGPGICAPRPGVCPADCPGVCGCDGATYCNACVAAASGMDTSGDPSFCEMPPPPTRCGTRGGVPCAPDEFCAFDAGCGADDGGGVCTLLPTACPRIYDPVCGCDGRTHANECVANAMGVSVASRGECGSSSDCRSTGCPAGSYCSLCWTTYACIPDGAAC